MNNADKLPENNCQKMIHSEWDLIIDDLKKAGAEKVDYMKVRQPLIGDKEIKAIPLLLKHAEKKIHASNKEKIYRYISCADWLKGELLTETIDTLFRHFENDEMLFTQCNLEGALEFNLTLKDYEGVKTMNEVSTIDTRWVIGLALNALINHRLAGHKKYQARLQAILKNKKYRKGRSQLVLAYARLGKQEVIQDLIDLLEGWDLDVLGNTIVALGNVKAKEAKPYLEKLLKHENTNFRDLARKALKKIG
ncbi:MAG: HEAT repeat domain-containing protein [Methylobacter sp.]